MVRLLLEASAEMDSRDFCSRTPLMSAAFCGQAQVVQLLLHAGANKEADWGSTVGSG